MTVKAFSGQYCFAGYEGNYVDSIKEDWKQIFSFDKDEAPQNCGELQ